MYLKTAAEIATAMLAVFGAYALFRLLVTARFLPRYMGLLLEVTPGTTLEQLQLLLAEAMGDAALFASGRVCCLLERGCDEALLAWLAAAGITYYILDAERRGERFE